MLHNLFIIWKKGAAGRIPGGLLGMIVLIAAVEGSIESHRVELTNLGNASWRWGGDAVWKRAEGRELLCFGDSLLKTGIVPRILERKTGLKAYNFAVHGAQPPATYFLLRRALAAGAKPKAAVVEYIPNMLTGGPRDWARLWPELATPREIVELAWNARDATFLASTLVARVFPSVRRRSDLRVRIVAALNGDSKAEDGAEVAAHLRNWEVNLGAQLSPPNPSFSGVPTEKDQKDYMTTKWWCDKINRLYIERFLELARSRGITVFWLAPPISPKLQAERERGGSDRAHTKFIADFGRRFPNLIVLDGRGSGFPKSRFVDLVHLDRDGAPALSDAVGTAIAEVLRGNREEGWIVLPRYRPVAIDRDREDVRESRIAIEANDGRVRR